MSKKVNIICTCLISIFVSGLARASTCTNQIPVISGDSSAITTSGSFSSSYPAWQAFDGSDPSMWISELWETPAGIGYEFDTPKTIDSYSISYTNGSITTRAPKDFELQGSNGRSWVTLDVRTDETNWQGSEERNYSVLNPGAYKKYRLYVTDDNDPRNGVEVISIGELELESCSCHFNSEQVPILTGNSSAVDASGIFGSSYPSWQSFDSNFSSMWISEGWETPAWISYEWTSPRRIEQYSIHYANGSIKTRAPKDWQLQGWDGATWVTVDLRYDQTNWDGSEERHFNVTSPGSYFEYRLYVEDDNDDRDGIVVISMGNLSLRGCQVY